MEAELETACLCKTFGNNTKPLIAKSKNIYQKWCKGWRQSRFV